MSTYTVLCTCNGGHGLYLAPVPYHGDNLSRYQARKLAARSSSVWGIVRDDRVQAVCEKYREENN